MGDELRQVRAAARAARLAGLRAAAEAATAANRSDHETAVRWRHVNDPRLQRRPHRAPRATDGMPIGCEVLLRRYSERISCATPEELP